MQVNLEVYKSNEAVVFQQSELNLDEVWS